MAPLFATEHPQETGVDISSLRFWARPFEARDRAFERLRREYPVSWHPALETPGLPEKVHGEKGFWAVTRVADIAEVSRHPELFSSSLGQVSLRPAPFRLTPNMLVMDPPLHSLYRRVVSDYFTPRAVQRLERQIRGHSTAIVARVPRRGRFDVVSTISAQLPLRTIAGLLGLPASEHEPFVVAADAYAGSGIPTDVPPGMTIESFHAQQVDYLRGLTSALADYRSAHPGDDVMTQLVSARIEGRRLTAEEILSTVLLLVVAGDETTKQAITLSLLALATHPEQRAWLIADYDARVEGALDELLRWASPIMVFTRTATRDTVLHRARISAGDKVALFYCSGNRDEEVCPDPGRFDLARPRSQSVAFGGGGVHYCLGSSVARAQLGILLREIVLQLPNLELGAPSLLISEFIHGVTALRGRVRPT